VENKLQAKDLINVGIFTALYFVIFFATGMLGYIPILMLLIPFLCPLVAGIPFMLFMTRVNKFGMVTIMGTILGLLMLLTGHPWTIVPFAMIVAFLGDLVLKSGDYSNWSRIKLGYVVFSQWLMGLLIPIFFMRDSYFQTIRAGYRDAYTDALLKVTPPWVFWAMIVLAALGAFTGATIGRAALKKHFQRAGIA
jgi:energy-coupling factor transport system substrate-specific component